VRGRGLEMDTRVVASLPLGCASTADSCAAGWGPEAARSKAAARAGWRRAASTQPLPQAASKSATAPLCCPAVFQTAPPRCLPQNRDHHHHPQAPARTAATTTMGACGRSRTAWARTSCLTWRTSGLGGWGEGAPGAAQGADFVADHGRASCLRGEGGLPLMSLCLM
jgi:hypothetical protein